MEGVKRMAYSKALVAPTTHQPRLPDEAYVADLGNVIDFDVIRNAGVRMGVDPLGGAGVHLLGPHCRTLSSIDLTVVSEEIDKTFRFMSLDWDGQIRMDPSSPYAMQRLLEIKDQATTSRSPATPTTTVTAS